MKTENPEVVTQVAEGWPEAAQKYLDGLYARYGSNQSDQQKYNVLLLELGYDDENVSFSHNPDFATKRVCLEYEILARENLIELQLA